MDFVQFHTPPRRRVAHVRAATWVEFYQRGELSDKKRRGFVWQVDGNTARVMDEYTWSEARYIFFSLSPHC